MIVLGASAYPAPLPVGCVPIAMQTVHEVEALNYSEHLIVEHNRGNWFLHCGRYATQQGGCIPCFLHKAGVFDFCPWHPEDDPQHYRSGFQILHLVGKIQSPDEVNVMGYIDEFPPQCPLIFSMYSRTSTIKKSNIEFALSKYHFSFPPMEEVGPISVNQIANLYYVPSSVESFLTVSLNISLSELLAPD